MSPPLNICSMNLIFNIIAKIPIFSIKGQI